MVKTLDVVVFGATGFVGRLVAEHLAGHAPSGVRIGLAGRSTERLAAVREGLGPAAAGWPLLRADVGQPETLATLAASTRVLASTVGPYARYGLPVVEACAAAGTDYVDLTGEVTFVRDSADRHHDRAVASGARIVHSCGFDSIPSDLGVLVAFEAAQADGAGELTDTVLVVRSLKGGLSGGTIDSMRTQIDAMRTDRQLAKLVLDPYALSPDRSAEPELGPQRDQLLPGHDRRLGVWTAPFVMGSYNTRIVRRSNALQGWRYGQRFRYRETMSAGRSLVAPARAGAITAGMGAAGVAMALPPTRAVLDRLLPSPGEGPNEAQRSNGHFRVDIHASTSSGARYVVAVAAKGDPGYAATSVMLGESALCLALEPDRLPGRAGVLTPASGIGMPLVERLRAAGFRFDVERAAER